MLVVALLALLAIVIVRRSDAPGRHVTVNIPAARSVAATPPAVLPVELLPVAPQDARAINAAVPFVTGATAAARPFRWAGDPITSEAALTCLAAAEYYEAGDDASGQSAVAQVVLNRMRHPAFPNTICGVVFQGSDRPTGCQFTFTCDGALSRRPSPAAWARARFVARRALGGYVDKRIGLATHYHTDWVVPYWSKTLDKLVAINTHLFFRWRGGWGQLPAFRQQHGSVEHIDSRIIDLADSSIRQQLDVTQVAGMAGPGATLLTLPLPVSIKGISKADLNGSVVRLADPERGMFVLQLDPGVFSGSHVATAAKLCRGRQTCSVLGYLYADRLPAALPVPPDQMRRASFYYHRTHGGGADAMLWNCQHMARPDSTQCFPGTGQDGDTSSAVPPD